MASREAEAIRIKQESQRQTEAVESLTRQMGLVMAHLGIKDAMPGEDAEPTNPPAEGGQQADDAWRGTSVEEMGLSAALLNPLVVAGISDAGTLADKLDAGDHIEGIGPAKADQLQAALNDLKAK